MKRLLSKMGRGQHSKTAVEYLPDADEIERSPIPRSATYTLHVLFVGLFTFVLWATLSQLDQVVTAQGRLVSPYPNMVVQPLEDSIIKTVDVRAGQVVKKGQVLATLDGVFVQADEQQLRLRMQSLETQIHGLRSELRIPSPGKEDDDFGESLPVAATADNQLQANLLQERRANYQAQQYRMSEKAAQLRAMLASNLKDQRLIASRLKPLKDLEALQEKMVAQKYGSPLQLLEAQQRSKEVERELEMAQNRELELRRELGAFEAEKLAFEKGWRQKTMEELLALQRERDAMEEQLKKADKRQSMVTLTAPADAVVLEIAKLSPGSIVKGAETFFTLVPLNVELEAQVDIGAKDVGYIKVGHMARVKLDAFPFQKHGTLEAKVRSISEDSFRRENNDASAGDSYYIGRISLAGTQLKAMNDGARLMPGMTVTAEIVVGQRSIMSYLAWPLIKGFGEAVREP